MALTDGLVGHWSPSQDDAGNGTTTLTDLSGNGNHGTLTNMDPATDWVADTANGGVRALDFDGVDDYVTMGLATVPAAGYAVSMWMSPAKTAASSMIALSCDSGAGGQYIGSGPFGTGNGWIFGDTATATSKRKIVEADIPAINIWFHVILIVNSSSVGDVYVNDDDTLDFSTTEYWLPSNNGKLQLACRFKGSGPSVFFNGKLDDIRIYNRVPTTDEITLLASSRVPSESSQNTRRRRLAMGGTL